MQLTHQTLTLIAATAIGCSIIAAEPKDSTPPEFASPGLADLDFLVGVWKVAQDQYSPTGSVVATAEGTEEITWILDKHAIQRVYRTKTSSLAFEAVGLLTWNDAEKRYEGSWLDNVSTGGPTRVDGRWNEKEKSFVFDLDTPGPDGRRVKYQTIDRIQSDTVRVATTYEVKGSEIIKVSEVKYTRTTPCPARMRFIFDD